MQAFFAAMLRKDYLGDADRARGRFRTFLLTAVKHFLANECDKAVPIDPIETEAWYVPEAVKLRITIQRQTVMKPPIECGAIPAFAAC
jgi:hypothetical protein